MEVVAEIINSAGDLANVRETARQADQRAADYVAKLNTPWVDGDGDPLGEDFEDRYEDFCEHIKTVIKLIHDQRFKYLGIGKMSVLRQLAEDDPDQFLELKEQIKKDNVI